MLAVMTTTKVWFRNPHNYHRQIVEVGHAYTVWHWSSLLQRSVSPVTFSERYFSAFDWETLAVGGKGVSHYRKGDRLGVPTAVYPFFSAADDDPSLLIHLLQNPVGESDLVCNNGDLEGTVRPVAGQDHVVVVGFLHDAKTYKGKSQRLWILDLMEEYPEAKIHIFGATSLPAAFGMGQYGVDVDPREHAARGNILLPNGFPRCRPLHLPSEATKWITMFDMNRQDLDADPALRCVYNMKSALWAGNYYKDEINVLFRKKSKHRTKDELANISEREYIAELKASNPVIIPLTKRVKVRPGDKLHCNHCSLQLSCKVYREGMVCTLPNSDGKRLAQMFGTRDAEGVIDGLSQLLQMQANRLQDAMAEEENEADGLNPEVSKEIKATFENGKTLAQLLNPALKGGPKVVNNVSSGNTANTLVVDGATTNQMIGAIVRSFEQQGISRDQITPEMLNNAMAAVASKKAIQA